MSRPCHVFDYDGEYLASFADWDVAHAWARLQALMNGVPAPLEVEDRRRRIGCRVWADRCETTGGVGLDGDEFGGGEFGGEADDAVSHADDLAEADEAGTAPSWGARDLVTACVGARGFPFAPPRPRSPS